MDLGFEGRIPICMKCGSRSVRHQTSGDGLWPAGGEGVAWVCDACHHIGAPFLMDRQATAVASDPAWEAEYQDAAFGLDDDSWHPPPRMSGRTRALGGTFVAVGALFLLPVASALHEAASLGSAYAVVRAIVGTGWLLAIGLAMLLVGLRRIRVADTAASTLPQDAETPDASVDAVDPVVEVDEAQG